MSGANDAGRGGVGDAPRPAAQITQETDARGRRYIITSDGKRTVTPSVTTILGALPKKGLDWWGFKLGLQAAMSVTHDGAYDLDALYADAKLTDHAPHRALRKAGARGTDVHQVAEVLLRDGRLEDLPANTGASEGYVDALLSWHDERGVSEWDVVAVEARLFSATHLFAGTADVIAKRPDGVYVVGDFKTSKGIYESHMLQATAYAAAAREMGLIPDGAEIAPLVIRLDLDGSFEVRRSIYEIEDFVSVQRVHALLADKAKAKGVVEE